MNKSTIDVCIAKYLELFPTHDFPESVIYGVDEPISLKPIEGIGKIRNSLTSMIANARLMDPNQMELIARQFRDNEFLSKALFYYAISAFSRDNDLESVIESAENFLGVNPILPYTVYSLDRKGRTDMKKNVVIFVDFDGTITDKGAMRQNFIEFLDYYQKENQSQRKIKYSIIITSASIGLDKKVEKLDKSDDIISKVQGIYEVPVVTPSGSVSSRQNIGKVYTDICKKLNISPNQAIILTDQWLDRSIENSYPIITLVTPPGMYADSWIKFIEKFQKDDTQKQENTFRDFRKGAEYITRNPSHMIRTLEPINITKTMATKFIDDLIEKTQIAYDNQKSDRKRVRYENALKVLENQKKAIIEDINTYSKGLNFRRPHDIRVYTIDANLSLIRTTKLEDTFFMYLGEPPKHAKDLPTHIKAAIQSPYLNLL